MMMLIHRICIAFSGFSNPNCQITIKATTRAQRNVCALRVCVNVRKKERERESVCVCVCVCVRVCVWERTRVCMRCACIASVCVCVCVQSVHGSAHVPLLHTLTSVDREMSERAATLVLSWNLQRSRDERVEVQV